VAQTPIIDKTGTLFYKEMIHKSYVLLTRLGTGKIKFISSKTCIIVNL